MNFDNSKDNNNIKIEDIENILLENGDNNNENSKKIFNININSLNEVFTLMIEGNYDFVTFEPFDDNVKIEFRKDKLIVETKYIKFPIYSQIIIKAKILTKLNLEESNKEQEGVGEFKFKNNIFEVISKFVPGENGEKTFLKLIQKNIKQKNIKEVKKLKISQIFGFLGALATVGLILGGSFLGFIVLNAQTLDDIKFFAGLGINLNEINSFISKLVSIIFSIILFLETILLVIVLFKFLLTKKEFKKKKIKLGIFSTILLIITFSSASSWMFIDQKIKELPNWQEMALGEIQIYDNSKLISDSFDKVGSIISDTSNLIGPVEIKFDLEFFEQTQKRKGINILNYIWDFGDGNIIETPLSSIIKNFDEKGVYNIKLKVIEQDLVGNLIEKIIEDVPVINIQYTVKLEERILNNGGKEVNLDASEVSQLGRIQWYLIDDLSKPVFTGNKFFMPRPIFEETIIGMYIDKNDRKDTALDKLFIIKPENSNNLNGEIKYQRGIINDLEFTFSVVNVINDFGAGYIQSYKWKIGDREYTKAGDIMNQEKSSETKHIFSNYGEYEIIVELTNSAGNTTTLRKNINIPKVINITKGIDIYADGILLDNIDYRRQFNEYFINMLGVPNEMKFDARFIEIDSPLYTLQNVSWDFNSNGDNDFTGRVGEYAINSEGNHTITFTLSFVNRRISDDIIKVEQKIFIEAIRKEAVIDFNINQTSEYVPTIIGFDASRSTVRDSNIVKFIWNYGDGVIEERDAVVPGRRYIEPGIYDISLTVITNDGKQYSKTKKLILKPAAQTINIKSSMRNAPVFQGIDFSSSDSEGQISAYFWDFGDGNVSTNANPTHNYTKPGEYNVKLRLDFSNRNVLEDSIKINIY